MSHGQAEVFYESDDDDEWTLKKVVKEEWHEEYRRLKEIIYSQLVELNKRLYIAEQLYTFPIRLFVPIAEDSIFFHAIRRAVSDSIILDFYRLWVDSKNSYTIRRFKNQIIEHIRVESLEKASKRLRNHKTSTSEEELLKQIKKLRHEYIAHRPDQQRQDVMIDLEEMQQLFRLTLNLYNDLTFEVGHSLWPWGWFTEEQRHKEIDEYLNGIVRSSAIANAPEKDPGWLEHGRDQFSVGDIQQLNKYRKRIGLPEVP